MLDVKLPPQDLEAEKSVLSTLLVDGEAIYRVADINKKLKERNLKKSDLTSMLRISSRILAKISKGEKLADGSFFCAAFALRRCARTE